MLTKFLIPLASMTALVGSCVGISKYFSSIMDFQGTYWLAKVKRKFHEDVMIQYNLTDNSGSGSSASKPETNYQLFAKVTNSPKKKNYQCSHKFVGKTKITLDKDCEAFIQPVTQNVVSSATAAAPQPTVPKKSWKIDEIDKFTQRLEQTKDIKVNDFAVLKLNQNLFGYITNNDEIKFVNFADAGSRREFLVFQIEMPLLKETKYEFPTMFRSTILVSKLVDKHSTSTDQSVRTAAEATSGTQPAPTISTACLFGDIWTDCTVYKYEDSNSSKEITNTVEKVEYTSFESNLTKGTEYIVEIATRTATVEKGTRFSVFKVEETTDTSNSSQKTTSTVKLLTFEISKGYLSSKNKISESDVFIEI